MLPGAERSTATRFAAAVVLFVVGLVVGLLVAPGVVAAHTDFDGSVPADGDVVDGPLTEIVLDFTTPAEPAGDGFEVLGPDGALVAPASVDPTDGTSFVLTFEPPLEAGTYGVRWSVRAGDAHPIDGSFRFDVSGTSGVADDVAAATPVSGATTVPEHAGMDMDAADHAAMTSTDEAALEAFLATDDDADATSVGRFGRMLSMTGLVFGAGMLAALVWTVRGSRDELSTLLGWVRLCGLLVLTGGLASFAAITMIQPDETLGALASSEAGMATMLKIAGGLAVFVGFHSRAGRITGPAPSLSAAVVSETALLGDQDRSGELPGVDSGRFRWAPTPTAAVGLVGWAVVFVSYWFDGHTVTQGPRVVHVLANLVHLGAAAVWAGGVFAMATIAFMRRRRSDDVDLAAMVVRFSSIATVSLVGVIVAGTAMTFMIVDVPGDVFGTTWGRVLLAKIFVVAVAAGLGAFNHFRLRPALVQRPDDPGLARELRASLVAETVAFVVVVALTAALVAAAI